MSITYDVMTDVIWTRLHMNGEGVMTTLKYHFKRPASSDLRGSLLMAWHDGESLECPCGGDLYTGVNSKTGANYVSQTHSIWRGQHCPPDRIEQIRRDMKRSDQCAFEIIKAEQLVPFPDNPQI